MELFFDLVFVVVVDQVSQRLEGPITATTVGGFVVLAVLVWWAWVGYVYYVDRFGTDDLRDRLTTLAQMGAATALTVSRLNAKLPLNSAHLQERFGNFTLIVIGEGIVAVIDGLRDLKWSAGTAGVAALAFAVGFALWWVYFETSDGAPVEASSEGRQGPYLAWVYAHLPFTMGIGAAAMAVGHAIHDASHPTLPDPTRWLFAGAIALCFVGLSIINLAYAASGVAQCNRVQSLWMLATVAAALGVAALGGSFPPLAVFGIVALVSVAQVGVDMWYSARAAD